MKHYVAQCATTSTYQLAEGPLWDHANDRLLWVDINAGNVHEGHLTAEGIEPVGRHHVEDTVGAVALAEGRALLVAGHHTVYLLDARGKATAVAQPIGDGEPRRFNDGKCDPAGRFVVGTLSLTDHANETLYQVDAHTGVAVLDDDVQMSNGLGWSPDGGTLYSVDTLRGVVWRRSYDPTTGSCGPREEAIRVDDGSPDGMCVDVDGNIWLAVWGAGQVRHFTPRGDLLGEVTVDAPYTSCCAFVGPNLDRMVITTAIDDLTAEQQAEHPHSGALFLADVNTRGLPSTPWRS